MKQVIYPVCCAHIISWADGKLVFRTFSGELWAFKSNLELIMALVQKSTGAFSADEITQVVQNELNISAAVVKDVINDLVVCEILMDSHEQFLKYHTLTYNPPRYPSPLSFSEIDELTRTKENYIAENPVAVYGDTDKLTLPLYEALQKRHSCRAFLEMPIEIEKLFAICKVSCSCRLRPIASAGALFPLTLYFINRLSSGRLPAGLYQYDPQNENLLLLRTDICPESIQYSLNDADYIFGAPCIFFVGADTGRHMRKYSNAGYRYTLLEAGHAVQNMTIAAQEMGLGGVEYGGFCDEAVKELFGMPETVFPLACFAAGYGDEEDKNAGDILQKDREKRIIEKIVRSGKPDMTLFLMEDENLRQSNLRVMVSKFEDTHGRVEFGTGMDPTYGRAYLKSVMEAYERYALSCRYFDRLECADKLKEKYLDPNEYVPYSDDQREENKFAKFRTDDPVEWVQGYDLEGNYVYVPADLCFDVPGKSKKVYHLANSSGCAAHFDIDVAKQSALLELIERDAIVKCWLYRQTPDRLTEEFLPCSIRQRLERYQEKGISVFILSLPCEYAYTVLVCSVNNNEPPYFVSGAAASFSSIVCAAVKAFDEWEVSYVLGGSAKDADRIVPEKVILPGDHGNLYRYGNYNREIAYLLQGRRIRDSEVKAGKLGDTQALNPVFVNYRLPVDGVCVIRAFSKELVPVNFGYGMDFSNHCKINKQFLKKRELPHFFS